MSDLQKEVARKLMTKHGMYYTPEYKAWHHMKERCFNPNNKRYAAYGGRGIKVCDKWMTFEGFFEDMGKRPSAQHSLDRLNNNGNYEPNNCAWRVHTQQAYNRRNTVKIEYEGGIYTIKELSEKIGKNKDYVRHHFVKKKRSLNAKN